MRINVGRHLIVVWPAGCPDPGAPEFTDDAIAQVGPASIFLRAGGDLMTSLVELEFRADQPDLHGDQPDGPVAARGTVVLQVGPMIVGSADIGQRVVEGLGEVAGSWRVEVRVCGRDEAARLEQECLDRDEPERPGPLDGPERWLLRFWPTSRPRDPRPPVGPSPVT